MSGCWLRVTLRHLSSLGRSRYERLGYRARVARIGRCRLILGRRCDPGRSRCGIHSPRVKLLLVSDQGKDRSLRAYLNELLSLTDSGLRTVTIEPEQALAHGWFVRSVDMIRGALLLYDNGLGSAAHPLVRSAMEHVVGLLWLKEVGWDALPGLSNAHQGWARNVKKAIALSNEKDIRPGRRDWSPDLDAVIAEIEEQEHAQVEGQWKIAERFKIAQQFDLYVAWLSETASSHATQASATPYLKFRDDRFLLLPSPQEPDTDAILDRCAVVAVIGFRAMGEALGSDYWRANVDRLDESITYAFQRAGSERLAAKPSDDWLGRFDRR